MNDLGLHTITANDYVLDLGPVTLGADDDTLWVKVRQEAPVEPWPFSYGLLYFETLDGRTLGTTKAYAHPLGEFYRLGIGRPPLERSGRLYWDSRHYNLGWVKAKDPPSWTLSFQWESGQSSVGTPSLGSRATLGVLADLADTGVSYSIREGVARILLSRIQ